MRFDIEEGNFCEVWRYLQIWYEKWSRILLTNAQPEKIKLHELKIMDLVKAINSTPY